MIHDFQSETQRCVWINVYLKFTSNHKQFGCYLWAFAYSDKTALDLVVIHFNSIYKLQKYHIVKYSYVCTSFNDCIYTESWASNYLVPFVLFHGIYQQ